ncbi:MAG TPA: ATP-binding protein, partial [Tepidisphaeraceae bacterium]
ILLWGKLLQGKKVDPKALKDGLQAIVQSANAQQRLIEDLLDTARIATGKLRLELLETDLAATVSAAVETVRPTAVVKGVEIVTDMGSDIGMVMADSDRLRQVVWNLLSNAVKFTPQGGTVNIGMWRRGGWVEIRVTDSGRGIAPDMVDHVFERFNQSDPASTRRSGGLGLGLAISRQLVELHGGTITAASEGPGKGAAFTVMLPLPSGDMAQQLEAAFDLTGRLKGVRILLVEDDETTRDAMTAVLKKTGAIVQAVDSVDDALAAIDKERPDLLLSDIGLPLKDGYHLVRELRQRELDNNQPALPAVALTAFGRLMDQAKGLESGFNEHLSKPIEPRRLVAILQRLVRQSESS